VKMVEGSVEGKLRMGRSNTPQRGRINDKRLFHLLVERGLTQREVAAVFGVTEQAVSKRVKLLGINLTRHVGLERAKEVADHGLDVVAQLAKINVVIRTELEWATSEAAKPDGDRRGLQQTITSLAAEIRKQLTFQMDVVRALYDVRAMAEFQQEVLDAIGGVSEETKHAIIQRLAERRRGHRDAAGILRVRSRPPR
jgi:transcriptional regulator with XRE-family HTH domain